MLDIYAGATAKKTIEQNGFKQELFDVLLGASGGPKWFTLFGLDKYLFGEFFKGRTKPLDMVGSSAGAFRAACFAQSDPVAAISELAARYSTITYTKKPSAQEITQSAIDMTNHLLSSDGIASIAENKVFRPHFIVAKTKGVVAYENKILQATGLLKSIVLNRISRRYLNAQFERYVFKPEFSDLQVIDEFNINTEYCNFSSQNVKPSLLASGAIPYVMSGVESPNLPKGVYRDGGIVDYHFDVAFNREGLILYPHFCNTPKAGWFDKNLSRGVNAKNYQNTLLLVPSKKFVASLPYGKIPDRNDFTMMSTEQRLAYWRTVLFETERLAESLAQLIESQDVTKFKPLPF